MTLHTWCWVFYGHLIITQRQSLFKIGSDLYITVVDYFWFNPQRKIFEHTTKCSKFGSYWPSYKDHNFVWQLQELTFNIEERAIINEQISHAFHRILVCDIFSYTSANEWIGRIDGRFSQGVDSIAKPVGGITSPWTLMYFPHWLHAKWISNNK